MTEQTDPTVNYVQIYSAYGIQDNLTNAGDVVYALANFSETVFVTNGTPTLTLAIGSDNRTATYYFGSGSDELRFLNRIQAGDTDTNGISIDNDSLALNSGFIRDASGNYATITHSANTNDSDWEVK